MNQTVRIATACAVLVAGGLFASCGQAEAGPLEVTYYYLPG